jgi:hypothetical protein
MHVAVELAREILTGIRVRGESLRAAFRRSAARALFPFCGFGGFHP